MERKSSNGSLDGSFVDQLPTTANLGLSTKESIGDDRETEVVKTVSVDRPKEADESRATDESPVTVEAPAANEALVVDEAPADDEDQSDHNVPPEDPSQIVETPQDEEIKSGGTAQVEKPTEAPGIVVSEAPAVISSESMSRAEEPESDNTEQGTSESDYPSQGVTKRQGSLDSVTNNGASKIVQKVQYAKEVESSRTQTVSRRTLPIPVDKHDLIENFDQVSTEEGSSSETEDEQKLRERSLGHRPGLSETPSTHVLPSTDHSTDRPEPRPRTPKPRGRDESSFVSMNQGWITVPRPMTIFSGEDTKETRYFGELYVRYLPVFKYNLLAITDMKTSTGVSLPSNLLRGRLQAKRALDESSTRPERPHGIRNWGIGCLYFYDRRNRREA